MDDYLALKRHYEQCFQTHGDTCKGVDWPSEQDAKTRYGVMLDVRRNKNKCTLLDFGCGTARLLDFIIEQNESGIVYSGLDISQKFIDFCCKKYPDTEFICRDILQEPNFPSFDYIILNGVFTEKRNLAHAEMFSFFKKMISIVFEGAKVGIAFNVMSKHVDWERSDLFHLGHDQLADFLCRDISRNYIIRNDYGLYEYTVYLYK